MAPAPKLLCLDGLRALAVLQVITFHHRLEGDKQAIRPAIRVLLAPSRFGWTGVHLFLVLSGFCLAYSLLRRERAGTSPSLVAYLRDRWWRIAPPYYAALFLFSTITVLCLRAGIERPEWAVVNPYQILTHLTFLHGLHDETLGAINPPFWSISLEFQFYLALPLLFALACRFGAWPVLAGVIASSIAWRVAMIQVAPKSNAVVAGFVLGRWGEFAMGMAVAFWYDRAGEPSPLRARQWAVAAPAILVATVAVTIAQPSAWNAAWVDFGYGVGYASLLAAALMSHRLGGRLAAALSWRPLAWLGAISYSVYLTHSLVLDWEYAVYNRLVPRPGSLGEAILFAASMAAILGVGWAFHVGVERRFLRSVDSRPAPIPRVSGRPVRRPGEAAAAPAWPS